MNLFELVALVSIVIGFAVGIFQAFGQGATAMLVGSLRGAGIGFGLYVVWMLAILMLLAAGQLYRPSFPRCRKGLCSARRYHYLSLDTEANPHESLLPEHPGGMLARCGCGTLYLRSARDRRVWEVAADGTLVPYMRFRPFGRWRLDREEPQGE